MPEVESRGIDVHMYMQNDYDKKLQINTCM